MVFREQELPLEADRSILVVGLMGEVIGIDRTTGEKVWENDLPGGGFGEVFIACRYGRLVVSADRNRVFRLDYRTGETLWSQATRSNGRATILIEPDTVVVSKSGYLDCFDHDGNTLWAQPLKGKGVGSVALAFPGNVAQADG